MLLNTQPTGNFICLCTLLILNLDASCRTYYALQRR